MVNWSNQRLRLWEDEPILPRAVPEERAGQAEYALQTAEAADGVVVVGATGGGDTLNIPARLGGRVVVGIGSSAFQGNAALRSVSLPEGLKRVGRSAFQGCSQLAAVSLPRTLGAIGESAFQGCAALEVVELPPGLDEIADRAFYRCAALKRVRIPGGVLRIGERAFAGCKALREVALPEGLICIAPLAFGNCASLKDLNIPDSVTELSANALPRTNMPGGQYFLQPQRMLVRAEVKRDFALPKGTRSLAGWALAGNESLLSVDFGDALERIGPYALADCACLKQALLPPTVRQVDRGAFSGCLRLTAVWLSTGLRTIEPETFRDCRALERVELSPGIQSVGSSAFEGCAALRQLALPEGVEAVGERAFYRCTSLERLALPMSLHSLGAGALSGCPRLKTLVLNGPCDGAMLSVLADAGRAAIIAPGLTPEAFPGPWRKRVCLGYALAVQEDIEYAPEAARGCLEWMRAHGDAFIAEALRDAALMHLLADGDCLSLEAVETLLNRAEGPGSDEYYVTLLDYRNRRFGNQSAQALSLW